MENSLDNRFTEKELEIEESIERTRKYLHFSPEEIENVCRIYEGIAKVKNTFLLCDFSFRSSKIHRRRAEKAE